MAQVPSFVKDVYPILEANCISCHSSGVKLGTLDLSTFEGIKAGGNHGFILVPGKSAESRLYLMIAGKMQPAMPMGAARLAAGDIETIRKWIDAGAKGPAPGEMAAIKPPAPAVPRIEPAVPVKPQIFSLAYKPDGTLLALGGFKEVRLADATGKASGSPLSGHAEAVRAVAFSRDGRLLAAAGGLPGRKGEVKIWDIAKRAEIAAIQGHDDCIYAVAISPDGKRIATSSYDKLIKIWDAGNGQEIRTLKDHIDAVYALAFTPDGTRIVSGAADRTVKIWNAETGERLYTFSEPLDGINTIALDPLGKRVAAAGLDKTIRVWSLGEKSGKLLNSQIAHEDAILKLAWSPDGKTLISASADRSIKIFNADDLTEIRALPKQPDWIYGLDFAPGGQRFAAGRKDGSLEIYEVGRAPGSPVAGVTARREVPR
jgi:WD40 repeat protein